MEILLGDFNAKVGRKNVFQLTIGNESLHQDGNDNDVRLVNFSTSKNLVLKNTTFLHRNFISTPGPLLMGRHNQMDHILIDRRWHLSILDV
jgi:hypothetical protein